MPPGSAPFTLDFDGTNFLVRAAEPISGRLRETFTDLVTHEPTDRHHVVRIRPTGATYRVSVDDRTWAEAVDLEDLADQLTWAMMRVSLDNDPHRVHLHAAALRLHHRGLLVAGSAGSGKSTFCVTALQDGWDYLTDERLAVDAPTHVVGSPKPVSLHWMGQQHFPELSPRSLAGGWTSKLCWQLPASSLGAGLRLRSMAPDVLVWLQPPGAGPDDPETIHPADAAQLLFGDSPDAARAGVGGLASVVRLCAGITCVTMAMSAPAEALGRVRRFLDERRALRAPAVSRLELARSPVLLRRFDEVRSGGRYAVHPDVHLVGAGDRSVAYRESTGTVVALDAVPTAWCQLLDGAVTLGELEREAAEASGHRPDQVRAMAADILRLLRDLDLVGEVPWSH